MTRKPQSWKTVDDLTSRRKVFVAEYARTGVGKTSAIKAGFSTNTAAQTASRLLKYQYIQKALSEFITEQVTHCKRPLRRALRNIERVPIEKQNLADVKKLLTRLIDLVEPDKTTHSPEPYCPEPAQGAAEIMNKLKYIDMPQRRREPPAPPPSFLSQYVSAPKTAGRQSNRTPKRY